MKEKEEMWYIFEREPDQNVDSESKSIQMFAVNLMDGITDSLVLAEMYQQQLAETHELDRFGSIVRKEIPKSQFTFNEVYKKFGFTYEHTLQLYTSDDKQVQLVLPKRFVDCFNLFTNSEELGSSSFIKGILDRLATDTYWLMNLIADHMEGLTICRTTVFRDEKDNPLTLGLVVLFVRLAYYLAGTDTLDETKALWLLLYGVKNIPVKEKEKEPYIIPW